MYEVLTASVQTALHTALTSSAIAVVPSGSLSSGLSTKLPESSSSPGLVKDRVDLTKTTDENGNVTETDTGEVTKGVKLSILYMKGMKALQEAMARIETLEAKVAALEGS